MPTSQRGSMPARLTLTVTGTSGGGLLSEVTGGPDPPVGPPGPARGRRYGHGHGPGDHWQAASVTVTVLRVRVDLDSPAESGAGNSVEPQVPSQLDSELHRA